MRSLLIAALCLSLPVFAEEIADAGTAAASAPVAVPAPAPAPAPAPEPQHTAHLEALVLNNEVTGVQATGPWYQRFTPFGYAKLGAFLNFPFREDEIVGSNGGFRLASLRLGVTFRPTDDLEVVASLEAAASNRTSDPSEPNGGTREVRLRDAYGEYRFHRAILLRAGQFKAPFWAETLMGDYSLPFINRSVVSDGVAPPESQVFREGLTFDRQIGLQLSSQKLGNEKFNFRYALAVVNGNGANQLFNDNNGFAPVGRVEFELFEKVTVAANGAYNSRTEGPRTNRINSTQLSFGADLVAKYMGFTLLGGFISKSTSYAGAILPSDNAIGALAQLHYLSPKRGYEIAFRFSMLDPSGAQKEDQVMEYAVLAGYRFTKVPVRVMLQFTHREEAKAVSIPNDSLDAMAQVTW